MKQTILFSIRTSIILVCMLALFACNNSPSDTQASDPASIEKYLDEKVMQPAFNGKVFSAHKIFKTENDKIFIWAFLQEYYKKDGKIEPGSGWSLPLVLVASTKNGATEIISHEAPGDGEQWSADIKRLFPKEIHQQIFDFTGTDDMRALERKSQERSGAL